MNIGFNNKVKIINKICLWTMICGLLTVLIGCSDNTYLSERLFWEAEKEVAQIYGKKDKRTDADYERAIAAYQKVVDSCPLEPMAAKAQFAIAGVYASQGKYTQAQKQFLDVINNFSSPTIASEAQLAIAKLYEAQGKWEKSLEEYDKLMDLYSLTPLGLSMPEFVVNYYKNNSDNEGAQKAYVRGVRHYKKKIEEFTETDVVPILQAYLAKFHAAQGNFKEAIEVWDKIIDSSPGSEQAVNAFSYKAEAYAQGLGDKAKAIETYKKFIQQYPRYKNLPSIKMRLGVVYFENNQLEEAKQVYQLLLETSSKDEDIVIKAYIGLSYCYRKESKTDKVIEIYEKIKSSYPDSQAATSVPFLIGQYYQEIGFNSKANKAYQEAIKQYQAILESDGKKEALKKEAAIFLSLCYIKTKKIEEALRLLRMLTERYPKEPTYLLDMATLYTKLQENSKAIGIYKQIIKKYPRDRVLVRLAKQQIQVLRAKAIK